MILIDFSDPRTLASWTAINDGVMGGCSHGQIQFDPAGHAVFSGNVSFANNGGFASVRMQSVDASTPDTTAFALNVRGDGKRYKFSVRTDEGFDGVNYQCSFQPPAERWIVCHLACADFRPTWRGKPLHDQPALDPARTRQLGLVIADRQEGPFALAIRAIAIDPRHAEKTPCARSG